MHSLQPVTYFWNNSRRCNRDTIQFVEIASTTLFILCGIYYRIQNTRRPGAFNIRAFIRALYGH